MLKPAPLPAVGTLQPLHRVLLFAEILVAYVPLLRRLRRNDLHAMVAEARSPQRRPTALPPVDHHQAACRLGQMVTASLDVLPTDRRCLIRALVTLRMLEHRSIDGRLVVGVATEGGFGAHAWVEHDGLPVLPQGHHERLLEL